MKSAKTKKIKTAKTKQAAAPVTHTPKKSRSMVETFTRSYRLIAAYKESLPKAEEKTTRGICKRAG